MSPILNLQKRLREAGRIRIGAKVPTRNGKMRPDKLAAFRFTSRDREVVKAIAGLYDGDVQEWKDAPVGEQWEVFTGATAIPILLPPAAMALSQWMELWSGGGCQRRCDGAHEVIQDGPCLCDPEKMECKPHTRLSLILTDLDGIGTFRLDTSGWNAANELAGSIEIATLAAIQGKMLRGRLLLEQRQSKDPTEGTRNYAVPALDLDTSLAALAGGPSTPERPALTPVAHGAVPSVQDQMAAVTAGSEKAPRANAAEPIKRTGATPKGRASPAEPEAGARCDGERPTGEPREAPTASNPVAGSQGAVEPGSNPGRAPASGSEKVPSWCASLHIRAKELSLTDAQLGAVVAYVTAGRTASTKDLKIREASSVNEVLTGCEAKDFEFEFHGEATTLVVSG